jgi:hypothetical protein
MCRCSGQQRGFPDPRLAADDQCAAALADPLDQPVDVRQLIVPADKRLGRKPAGF